MNFGNWLDRNGTKLTMTLSACVIAGFFTMVSLLITELGQENRTSILQIREDLRQMRIEMQANALQITQETGNNRLVIDRVETKVYELTGLFKYHPVFRYDSSSSAPSKP